MSTLIFYGLSIGAVLFLLAVGLTMIFGMLDVINFAHGAFFMLGAYIGYSVMTVTGNYWIAMIITTFAVGIIGAGVEALTLRPLYKKSVLYQLLLTFGLILIFEDIVKMIWGLEQLPLDTPKILSGSISLFGIQAPMYRLFVIAFVILIILGLFFFVERTKVGIIIRASSVNRKMARCLGINVGRVFTGTFGLGTALAGLSGMVAALMIPVNPGMGSMVILDCFIVVVLGGLGSLKGALIGALIIGEAQAFGTYYLPEYAAFPIYAITAVVLLVRPQGLFGEMRVHL